jgi:mono/diheme cytochrome c family protein
MRYFIKAGLVGNFWSAVAVLALLCSIAMAQKSPQKGGAEKHQASGDAARGKYIVEGVAMCGQCHTPRDSSGAPDRARQLEGAPVWLISAEPVPNWPLNAPRLAQSPPGSDAEIVKLLITGIWRDGKPLRPPMPQFRMSEGDAAAVVAYLKSMNPEPR